MEVKRLHLTEECFLKVRELRNRYPDIINMSGEKSKKLACRALKSFVTYDNPVDRRRVIYDENGNKLMTLDRFQCFVHVPRR